jgi:hypothetical protein
MRVEIGRSRGQIGTGEWKAPRNSEAPMTPDQIAQLESALCWVAFVAALAFTAVTGLNKGWWDE